MIENVENSGGIIAPQKNKPTINRHVEYREDGCLQPSPSISLTDDHTIIDIDGYICTLGDLKEHIIDSHMYREHIRTLMKEVTE